VEAGEVQVVGMAEVADGAGGVTGAGKVGGGVGAVVGVEERGREARRRTWYAI
jgi:hypothetical protein